MSTTASASKRAELRGRIGALLEARAKLEGVLLVEVAAFDAAGGCGDDGNPTTAAWLRARARLGHRDASGSTRPGSYGT